MKFPNLLIIPFFIIITFSAQAQFWEVGGSLGITSYHGDLAPDFSMQAPGGAGSIFLRHNIDTRLAVRFAAVVGTMGADDKNSTNAYRKARNLSFQSDLYEGSVALEFNFLPYHHRRGAKGAGAFTPYMVFGAGVFKYNPKAYYKGGLYDLQPLGTEGQAPGNEYSLVQANLIIGGGFKIDITHNIAINIEGSTRILFTDYLDDVSGAYANPRTIAGLRGSLGTVAVGLADPSSELGQQVGGQGRQRGEAGTNDGYTIFTVGLHYTIWSLKCPTY